MSDPMDYSDFPTVRRDGGDVIIDGVRYDPDRALQWSGCVGSIAHQAQNHRRHQAREHQVSQILAEAVEKHKLTHVEEHGRSRNTWLARNRQGLPVVVTLFLVAGTVNKRRAHGRLEIGPGPELEGLPVGCRKWRPAIKVEDWQRCERWRLVGEAE